MVAACAWGTGGGRTALALAEEEHLVDALLLEQRMLAADLVVNLVADPACLCLAVESDGAVVGGLVWRGREEAGEGVFCFG